MKKTTWKKAYIKKCITWFLVMTLLLPLLPLEVFADVDTAAQTETELETLDPTLEWVTFSDFIPFSGDLKDGAHTTPASGGFSVLAEYYSNGALDKALSGKVLCGDVTFSSNPTMFQVGFDESNSMWNDNLSALTFYRDWSSGADDLYLAFGGSTHTLTSDIAGTDLVENKFNLKLSFQEEDNQLKLGVWINDVLYNNEYFTATGDYAHYIRGFLGFRGCGGADGTITIASYKYTLDATLPQISFCNFNVADGENRYCGQNGEASPAFTSIGTYKNAKTGALTNKVFTGDVIFNNYSLLYVGGTPNAWYGLSLKGMTDEEHGEHLVLSFNGDHYIESGVAGVDLIGSRFNLKLSFQVANNKLKLGVWINDTLYNNKYFTLSGEANYAKYLYGNIAVYPQWGNISVYSCRNELDSNLGRITFSDFGGIQDGTYSGAGNVKGGEYHAASGIATALAGKVVDGNAEFSSDTAKLRFGFEADTTLDPATIWATNLQLWRKGTDPAGQLRLSLGSESEADTHILTSDIAGTDLVGKKFRLKLSFQEEDSNHDGTNDRLKLGVWINNVLYNNEYFYVTDRYERFIYGWMMVIDTPSPGYAKLSSIIEQSLSETTIPTKYKGVTPFDFGIVNNTYLGPGEGATPADYKCNFNTELPLASMDKVLFRTKITFDASTQLVYMRTSSSEWNGLAIRVESDGNFYLVNYLTGNYEIWGGAEKVATSESAWYYLNPKIAIDGATTLAGESFYLALTTEFVTCDTDGAANDLKLGIWFNDKLYNQQYLYIKDCLDVCEQGMLLCRTSEGSIVLESPSTSKREETNERYNLGDGPYLISGTGTILVNDVEYQNGDTLTEPGTYRIVSDNGAFVRNVELYDTGKKSSVLAYEDNVMPIVGFFGPLSGTDADGNPYNSVSDETYRLLEAAKFNLINYIQNDWSAGQEGQTELIQNLIYAEAHNIGMYVWDSALLSSDLEADTIAKSIAPYSQYGSFKGIHVVDEPGTDSYYSTAERQLGTYAGLAKAANGYCNLNGYINLFPYSPAQLIAEGYSSSEYESRYGAYLDEYITDTEARLLSYDNYVFATSRPAYYFTNLRIAREKSLNAGIPFWPYIQVGNNWVLDMGDDTRTPLTAEQFMWNVNTCLAYGAKGIQYYPVIQPYFENGSHEGDGVLDTNGAATDWYEHAAKINTHIAAIDEVLMAAESKAVLAKGYQAQKDTGISATSYGNLESVSLNSLNFQGTVIGAFDYQGKDAFYVVNYDMEKEQTITLKFKGSDTYEYRFIQNAITNYGEGNTCELTISAGEAVLVVLNDYAISDMELHAEITDSITMTYTTTLDKALVQTETPYMTFEMDGKVLAQVAGAQTDESSCVYKFTCPGVVVQDMAETIKATVSFGEYSKVYECSVLDYLADILEANSLQNNHTGETYTSEQMQAMKNLVVDLVKYGAAVQTYRDTSIADADLLTSKLEAMGLKIADFDKTDATHLDSLSGVETDKLSDFTGTAAYTWKNVTLTLKDKVNIRARFVADDLTGLVAKVSVGGKEVYSETLADVAKSKEEGVWYFDFSGIYAYEYGEKVEITFCNTAGEAQGATLSYSVNTYLNNMQSDSDSLSKLLIAIHTYGDAAESYYTSCR